MRQRGGLMGLMVGNAIAYQAAVKLGSQQIRLTEIQRMFDPTSNEFYLAMLTESVCEYELAEKGETGYENEHTYLRNDSLPFFVAMDLERELLWRRKIVVDFLKVVSRNQHDLDAMIKALEKLEQQQQNHPPMALVFRVDSYARYISSYLDGLVRLKKLR